MNIVSNETRTIFESVKSERSFSGVSVIVTLYNYAHTIEETLDTLINQTLKGNELIVIDDCSKDNGLAVVEDWMKKNAEYFYSVKLIQHVENGGLSIARNSAILATTGDFVFTLDADNHLYPRCLEVLHQALIENTEYAFSYPILERFEADTGLMDTLRWDGTLLAKGNYIDAMVLFRKSAWEDVGGYTVMKGIGWEDYEIWLKLYERDMKGLWVPQILARYRVHPGSMLNSQTNTDIEQVKLKKQLRELHDWITI